ncbi:MAG: hypothetical protein JSW58_02665, partial [Candidatus Latescibacterota bacterium]
EVHTVRAVGANKGVIRAVLEVNDADNDAVSVSHTSFRNGSKTRGQTGKILAASSCRKGDTVYAEILLSDGETEVGPFRTEPIVL